MGTQLPGEVRVELDGPGEVGERLVVTLYFLESLPAGSDGPGVAGVKLDGPVEVGQRLVVTLHQADGLPAAGDSPGVAGVMLGGPFVFGQRPDTALYTFARLHAVRVARARRGPSGMSPRGSGRTLSA